MTKYISKDAAVAEIEKRQRMLNLDSPLGRGGMVELQWLKDKLDTLEVKEVDLDALGVLAEHLIACNAHLVTPKYTDKELDLLEEWAKNNKAQKGE